MNNIGLVLSGGGIRGLVHIGVLEELEKIGVPINAIAGCSSGSIVGALYASGVPAEEIRKQIVGKKMQNFIDFSFSNKGIKTTKKLEEFIRSITDLERFEDMKIPLFINATNISKGEIKVFKKGDIFKAINASIAVPGVFAPVKIGGDYYVDGGVLDQIPFSILPKSVNKVIIVNASPIKKMQMNLKYRMIDLLESSYKLMQNEIVKLKLKNSRGKEFFIITPNVSEFRMFCSDKNFEKIIERGKLATREKFLELMHLKKRLKEQ